MTPQTIAWSHSRKQTYVECPKKFFELNIAKSVPYEQGEPQKEGERVHKALEQRLTVGVALPDKYAKFEPLIRAIKSLPGVTYGERDFALNTELRPTGYFEKDTWVRVTIDVLNINGKTGFMFDYKNGKVTLDEDQLKLYAAVGFHIYPEVDEWKTRYIWLQHKVQDGRTYHRSELPQLWRDLLPIPIAMQEAAVRNDWPARPGRACAYCAVNKAAKCADASGGYRGS